MKTMANCSHWSIPLPQPEIPTNCCLQLPNTHLYVDWVSSSIKQSLWSNWHVENRKYPKRLSAIMSSTTSTTCSKNLGKSESLNTTRHPRDTHNSNYGMAEWCIQSVKSVMKKVAQWNCDINIVLLCLRTTPINKFLLQVSSYTIKNLSVTYQSNLRAKKDEIANWLCQRQSTQKLHLD